MTVKVSVSELPSYYDSCLGLPMLVTGESGIGKTEITKQWTEARSLACVDVRASQLDPSDVKGVPYREGLASRWAIPDFLPQVDRDGEEGVLVLDEYLDGDESVFSAFQQLILERRLGDYIFPDKWMIIALGNKKEHGGVNRGLSSAQQDRFVHLEASLDHDSLKSYFIKKGISPLITSFIHTHPDLAHKRPERGSGEWAWPTPRSYERIDSILKKDPDKSMRFNLFAGLIGEGAAHSLDAHIKLASDVPDPLDCIKSPESTRIPENASAKYAISCSLARYSKPKNFANVIKYVDRLGAEFSTLLMMESKNITPELIETDAFVEWAMEHSDVLLG